MCKQESSPDKSTKIYARKELVMMETTISDFHTSFYIPAIQNLDFHIPHVRILGTNHCSELQRTAFKRRELFQDVLCRRDYVESCMKIRYGCLHHNEFFLAYIFVDLSGEDSCLHMEQMVLSFNESLP